VLEAQACGCPVFTTGRPPMTEVGGEAAVYFNPSDPAEAAQIIAKVLPERMELREKGLVNVSRFSSEKMIHSYINAYEFVIKQKSN